MSNVVDQGNGKREASRPQELMKVDVQVVWVEVELGVVHALQFGDDEEVGSEANDDEEVGGDVSYRLLLKNRQRGRLVHAGWRRQDLGRLLVDQDPQRYDDVQSQAEQLNDGPALLDRFRIGCGVEPYRFS